MHGSATLESVRRLLPLVLVSAALVLRAGGAWAAGRPELVLPATEDPANWADAVGLGGFDIGSRAVVPRVDVTVDAVGWHLKATDAAGHVRDATVPPPKDAQGREDMVWLARSLLTPASSSRWATASPSSTSAVTACSAAALLPPMP